MLKHSIYQNKLYNRFMLMVFLTYCILMLNLLFFRGRSALHDTMLYNLIPFHTIKQYLMNISPYNTDIWVKNLFGNVILFIPLGVGIPTLNKAFMRVIPFTLLIIALIFTVEIIQMVTRVGSFDVDDIILNTLGALIGLRITIFVYRMLNKYKILR